MDGGKGVPERAARQVEVPAADVAADPQWVPHSYDAHGARLVFVRVPRAAQAALPFLWDEHFGGAYPKTVQDPAAIARPVHGGTSRPLHFVFHTAFCGSTLLMRALAAAAPVTPLKEPAILNNLAHRAARGGFPAEAARLDLALRLLARGFEGDAAVVVKPTNFAGNLALPILQTRPAAKAVLLHGDLRGFLEVVARRGVGGRTWGRRLFATFARFTPVELGYSPAELYEHTDLQAAALGWLLQMWHLRRARGGSGAGRTLPLAWSDFLAHPAERLEAVLDFLGLPAAAARAAHVAASGLFSRHSKDPSQPWDAAREQARRAAAASAHREEIELVLKWAAAVAAHAGLAGPDVPL